MAIELEKQLCVSRSTLAKWRMNGFGPSSLTPGGRRNDQPEYAEQWPNHHRPHSDYDPQARWQETRPRTRWYARDKAGAPPTGQKRHGQGDCPGLPLREMLENGT